MYMLVQEQHAAQRWVWYVRVYFGSIAHCAGIKNVIQLDLYVGTFLESAIERAKRSLICTLLQDRLQKNVFCV